MFGAFWAIIFIWAHRMDQNQKFHLFRFLIHAFNLKLHPSRVFSHMFVQEAIHLQCLRPRATRKMGNTRNARTYYVDDLYPICSKQHCSEYACIIWLYHVTTLQAMYIVATLQSYPQPLFLAQQWCTLKSLLFSEQHCWAGNRDLDLGIYYATVSGQFFSAQYVSCSLHTK